MRIVIRIIVFFLVLISVLISGFVLICALGIVSENQVSAISYSFYESLSARTVAALICVFIILISLLIALFRFWRRDRRATRVLTSRNGAIKISHRALSEMVVSHIKERPDVVGAKVKIRGRDNGVDVLAIVILKGNESIIKLTQELEQGTREMLTERCGVKVNGVEVFVDRIIKRK